jgi:ABC-type glycerol-3-phosphate transport system substrate-binding protein
MNRPEPRLTCPLAIALLAAIAIGLAACGGSSSPPKPPPVEVSQWDSMKWDEGTWE